MSAQPSYRQMLTNALAGVDWTQIALNVEPKAFSRSESPCFALMDDGRVCGRAKRWDGHKEGSHHEHMPLDVAVSLAIKEPKP